VTFEVWAGAALLLVLAVLYGRALAVLGASPRAAGPAVGFGIELIAANIGSELPGLAGTGAVILLVLAIAAVVVCVQRGDRPRVDPASWVVLAVGGLLTALPFISNGRTGLLGVSLDNDTAAHLVYAAGLTSHAVAHLQPAPSYYPLAPHALAAALSGGTGIRLDAALDGFTITTMLITALVGAAALRRESWWRRAIAGTLVAFLYLGAAYYGEDSFKELILGMLLLGFIVCLEKLPEAWARRERGRWLLLVPLAVLLDAGVYNYGYLAIAWFAPTALLWAVGELVNVPRRLSALWGRRRETVIPVIAVVAMAIVVLVPIAHRMSNLFSLVGVSPSAKAITVTNTGDLASGSVSPYEVLGIWHSFDFRLAPADVFHAGELGAFALAVVLFGLARSLARRSYALAAGVVACAIVYAVSAHGQSVYVTAKSLAIASPLVGLLAMRGLLGTDGPAFSLPAEWLRRAVAVIYVVLALWSSSLVLRSEPVWAMTGPDELMSFAHDIHGSSVLFLGSSEYSSWIFDHSAAPAPPAGPSSDQVATKAATPGTALDWDNETAATLDRYRYVVTTNSPNASQAPAAFRLVRRARMYELWKRVGAVAPRRSIETADYPGAVLDCSTSAGRRISRQRGTAALMRPPIPEGLGIVRVGATRRVSLRLPRGQWALSMQYVSGVPIRVTELGGPTWTVPAYLDQIGPFFAFARVRSRGGEMTFAVHAERPSFLTPSAMFLAAQVEAIVATALPDSRTMVPLRAACGRYVDWYRVARR
jgi:hypothetical protein